MKLFGSHLGELLWLDCVNLVEASLDVVQRVVLLMLCNNLLRCNLWISDSGWNWVSSHFDWLLLGHSGARGAHLDSASKESSTMDLRELRLILT